MDLTYPEERGSNASPLNILTPGEVARRLGVSENTALQLMSELPHINVNRDLYSGKKRIRITEQTYEAFVTGKITRRRLRRR